MAFWIMGSVTGQSADAETGEPGWILQHGPHGRRDLEHRRCGNPVPDIPAGSHIPWGRLRIRNTDADRYCNQYPDGNTDDHGHRDSYADGQPVVYAERNTWNVVRPDGQCSDYGDKLAELRGIVRHVRRLYG